MTCSHFWSPFVLRWEWSFCHMSEEHGQQPNPSKCLPILTPQSTCPRWSMAGNVTERTIAKGPLPSHSSPADPALTACHSNPLKVTVACYISSHMRTRPNGPCSAFTFTLSSPPSLLFPSEVMGGRGWGGPKGSAWAVKEVSVFSFSRL